MPRLARGGRDPAPWLVKKMLGTFVSRFQLSDGLMEMVLKRSLKPDYTIPFFRDSSLVEINHPSFDITSQPSRSTTAVVVVASVPDQQTEMSWTALYGRQLHPDFSLISKLPFRLSVTPEDMDLPKTHSTHKKLGWIVSYVWSRDHLHDDRDMSISPLKNYPHSLHSHGQMQRRKRHKTSENAEESSSRVVR